MDGQPIESKIEAAVGGDDGQLAEQQTEPKPKEQRNEEQAEKQQAKEQSEEGKNEEQPKEELTEEKLEEEQIGEQAKEQPSEQQNDAPPQQTPVPDFADEETQNQAVLLPSESQKSIGPILVSDDLDEKKNQTLELPVEAENLENIAQKNDFLAFEKSPKTSLLPNRPGDISLQIEEINVQNCKIDEKPEVLHSEVSRPVDEALELERPEKPVQTENSTNPTPTDEAGSPSDKKESVEQPKDEKNESQLTNSKSTDFVQEPTVQGNEETGAPLTRTDTIQTANTLAKEITETALKQELTPLNHSQSTPAPTSTTPKSETRVESPPKFQDQKQPTNDPATDKINKSPVPRSSNQELSNSVTETESGVKAPKKESKQDAVNPKELVKIPRSELMKWAELSNDLRAKLKKKEEEIEKLKAAHATALAAATASAPQETHAKSTDIERLKRTFESEKEALLDRNKTIQNLHDSIKDRFEKARRQTANLDFKNIELTKETRKIEEEMSFYKEQIKEKFTLQVRVNELMQEIAELKAFKEEALRSDAQVKNKELLSQNTKLAKQNEHLNQTIDRLEENTKRLVILSEKRTKETESAQNERNRFAEENKSLKAKIEELRSQSALDSKDREKEAETHNGLLERYLHETAALKTEIKRARAQTMIYQAECEAMKAELEQIIENVRKTHVSGADSKVVAVSGQRKEEKIILESLVQKNRELETHLRQSEKEVRRLKLSLETVEEKLSQKEASLMEAAVIASESEQQSATHSTNFNENELKRIHNAKHNKSVEEMRELVERVLVENIKLKRIAQSQKIILKN